MPPSLVACPSCNRHIKSSERVCATCGATIRRVDGSLPLAAGAVLLGLATAATTCSTTVESVAAGSGGGANTSVTVTGVPLYGPAVTTTPSGEGGSTTAMTPQPFYGPAQTTGPGGTTSGTSGQGGAGTP